MFSSSTQKQAIFYKYQPGPDITNQGIHISEDLSKDFQAPLNLISPTAL